MNDFLHLKTFGLSEPRRELTKKIRFTKIMNMVASFTDWTADLELALSKLTGQPSESEIQAVRAALSRLEKKASEKIQHLEEKNSALEKELAEAKDQLSGVENANRTLNEIAKEQRDAMRAARELLA